MAAIDTDTCYDLLDQLPPDVVVDYARGCTTVEGREPHAKLTRESTKEFGGQGHWHGRRTGGCRAPWIRWEVLPAEMDTGE